jgi:hypothetical protein
MAITGLSVEALGNWLSAMSSEEKPSAKDVHKVTGGHPLAMELLELYGQVAHGDWLRFLDEEIIEQLPAPERALLSQLAVAERPVPWPQLAQAAGWDGSPPKRLLERSLLLETDDGMWLHDALRERLNREVGKVRTKRKKKLKQKK